MPPMPFSQDDADRYEFLAYAATYAGDIGKSAGAALTVFEQALSPTALAALKDHVKVCRALRQGISDVRD